VDEQTISPAGDPFCAAAQHDQDERRAADLRRLEERYGHELLDDEERQELRDRVLRLRRRIGR
jgi:hypothetical protein